MAPYPCCVNRTPLKAPRLERYLSGSGDRRVDIGEEGERAVKEARKERAVV